MKIRLCLFFISFVLIILNLTHFFYFNIFTHSLPYGIYVRVKKLPQRGDYAASCLTPAIAQYGMSRSYLVPGNCPTGTVLVLKVIKGIPGDHFALKDQSFEINGQSYRVMEHDSQERGLKKFYTKKQAQVEKDRYILISDFVNNSWDSRYWGPVAIEFLLKPLWIWE